MFPDRIVPASGGLSCVKLQQSTLSGIALSHCDVHRDMLAGMSVVDIFAFCGCEGSSPPNDCSLCDSNATMASESRASSGYIPSTCGELTVAARYVVDPNYCQHIQLFAGDCCEVVDEAPDLPQIPCSFCNSDDIPLIKPDQGIPNNAGFTCSEARDIAGFFLAESDKCKEEFASWARGCCKPYDRCSICSDPSSAMLYPDRQLPFSRENMTCFDVEFSLGHFQKRKCDSFHDATASVDLAAWCGCEDAVPGEPSCSLCGDSDVIGDFQIPHAPPGVTCQSLAEWAPYIKDDAFCETKISLLQSPCCGLAETEQESLLSPPSVRSVGPDSSSSAFGYYPTLLLAFVALVCLRAQNGW